MPPKGFGRFDRSPAAAGILDPALDVAARVPDGGAGMGEHRGTSPASHYGPRRPFVIERCGHGVAASPEVALLISTFQKPRHLTCVLQSVAMQQATRGLFEVVVTDDGSTDSTRDIVREFAESVRFPVTLTTHPHQGFQLARCRNEGVAASTAPYLVFLDGDCCLPADHVLNHLRYRRLKQAVCGYCVRLNQETSQRFDAETVTTGAYQQWAPQAQVRNLALQDLKAHFYRLLRHPTRPTLAGGNCGMWRSDFERVNGYDENFEGWGGEDTDLGLRLRKAGVTMASQLRNTFSYHLWHPPQATAPKRIRDGVNQKYLNRGYRFTRCMNGLVRQSPADLGCLIVGQSDHLPWAKSLLRQHGLIPNSSSESGAPRSAECEFLFLPGRGHFSGRADCNVLVVREDCPLARVRARQAQIVVSDTSYAGTHPDRTFPLAAIGEAIRTIGG